MTSWQNKQTTVTIKLTAEESKSINLPALPGELRITALHSGHNLPATSNDPADFDIDIHNLFNGTFEDENYNEIELREGHYEAIWNNDTVFEKIINAMMEG